MAEQEPPRPAIPPCICFNLRRASRAVSQAYDGFLQPSGLRTTQFSLLGHLVAYGPMSMTELAERLGMDRTTLTRNLRPLERKGLVTVGAGETRRVRRIAVTEAGRRSFAAAKPLWAEAQRHFLDRLSPERWQVLRELLELAAAGASRRRPSGT